MKKPLKTKKDPHTQRAASSPKRKGKEESLRRLRSELAYERRERARLERELADLRRELTHRQGAESDSPLLRLRRPAREKNTDRRLLDQANRRAHHYRKKTFLRYLWESVMESAPIAVMTKLVLYLRRIRVVQIVLSLALTLGAVAAVAVLTAAVLPFLAAGTLLLALLAFLRSHRMNRILRDELGEGRIRVLVPPSKAALTEGSFFQANARAMAAEKGVTVLVVSPYLLSARGLGGRGGYFTARKEADGLYLVRKHYFFILRRRVLDTLKCPTTLIY